MELPDSNLLYHSLATKPPKGKTGKDCSSLLDSFLTFSDTLLTDIELKMSGNKSLLVL